MSHPARIPLCLLATLCLPLGGCGAGQWTLSTWGEAYIEDGIPADVFADDCAATFSQFLIVAGDRALVDGDGEPVGALEGAQVYDLTQPGPHDMGTVEVRATHYDEVDVTIAPRSGATAGNATAEQVAAVSGAGASVLVSGILTCGGRARTFSWAFQTSTVYHCEPEDLTIARGGADGSELTIHGDHLFYDDLASPDAQVRGMAIHGADQDGDGEVTLEELAQVPVADLGYGVGSFGDVVTLADFVAELSRTIGHIDGEGHCQIER